MNYTGKHCREINRAQASSKWGTYGATFDACLQRVPDHLRASLTAVQLAAVIDALRDAYTSGQANADH